MTGAPARPTWDEFFIGQLQALSRRATCDRGRSAAIFTRDNDTLATGYVGAPPGFPHCDDVGHLYDSTGRHCVRTLHAEQNAVIRAARVGVSLRFSTLYCTMVPCLNCAMTLVGLEVSSVIALHRYHASVESSDMLQVAGVRLRVLTDAHLYDPERP